MNGDPTKGIEDIMRRNVAALRSKANLTQQGLADEMLLRGIAWTRETVAQVETTNRRLGFTEAIAVAASLDVPVARLAATGAGTVAVGESEWTAAYLGAAIAGTTGDMFPPESYTSSPSRGSRRPDDAPVRSTAADDVPPRVITPDDPTERRTGYRRSEGRGIDVDAGQPEPRLEGRPSGPGAAEPPAQTPRKTAERIERRLRLRVTASDVDAAAQNLWSRSLDAERERRVTDRHALIGGSLQTIRGHVSRDLDREIAYEMERRPEGISSPVDPSGELNAEEATWEATRLNVTLANKGYSDSDVTRWWNFTRHRELGGQTIAEAWDAGAYTAVRELIDSLPDKHGTDGSHYRDD